MRTYPVIVTTLLALWGASLGFAQGSAEDGGIVNEDEPGDANENGVSDYLETAPEAADSDGDGIGDAFECPFEPCRDADGDDITDFEDADDDNDGVPTQVEGDERVDTNKDGVPDYLDTDDDGDGVPTKNERTNNGKNIDTDHDGKPDYLDTDDDNDDIPTKKELSDTNRDGIPDRRQPPTEGALGGGGVRCSVSARSPSTPLRAALLWLMVGALGALVARRR